MRRAVFLLVALLCTSSASAENLAIGIGATGKFYLVDGNPNIGAGIGGHAYFDYRWSPQIATQVTFFATTQDGKGTNAGDKDILLFGLPTIELKYYPLNAASRWDPYGLVGVGLYMTTEGSRNDGTMAFGLGASAGAGFDLLLNERFSLGASAIFRSIGMITSTSGPNNGTALFPLSLSGSVAYHF